LWCPSHQCIRAVSSALFLSPTIPFFSLIVLLSSFRPIPVLSCPNSLNQTEGDMAEQLRLSRLRLSGSKVIYPYYAPSPSLSAEGSGVPSGEVNFLNCLPILYGYISKVMKQSVSPHEIFDFKEEPMSSLNSTVRRHIVCVLYPSPQGVIFVDDDEINAFWGDESVSDVVLPAELLFNMKPEEIAKRRAGYVAVVRLHQNNLLNSCNEPTAYALNNCIQVCPPFAVKDNFRLKHRYAKTP
jgi:hypothetical protein